MQKSLLIEVLEILYEEGININVDIYPLIKYRYPKEKKYGYTRTAEIEYDLGLLFNTYYVTYSVSYIREDGNNETIPSNCDMIINASITPSGYQFLNDLYRDRSTIETNKSIQTNSKNQTITLIVASLLSLGSLIVSVLNYYATINTASQKQYVLPSKELTSILKKDTVLQQTEKHYLKEAKKPLPKKN